MLLICPHLLAMLASGVRAEGEIAPPSPDFIAACRIPGWIRDTREVPLVGSKFTLHRVRSPRPTYEPLIPKSLPSQSSAIESSTVRKSIPMLERMSKRRLVIVSATVFDHKYSFVRWQVMGGGGSKLQFTGWSNVDFNHFQGLGGLSADGIEYMLLMCVGNRDTAREKARAELYGRSYIPQVPPEMPGWEPTFILENGDPSADYVVHPIRKLHTLYVTERFRLANVYQVRQSALAEREAWLRVHPPVRKEPVLLHYAVQPKKDQPKRPQGNRK